MVNPRELLRFLPVNELEVILLWLLKGFACRSEIWVHNQLAHFVYHFGDENDHVFVWGAEVGIRVDFYEPDSEVFIYQEVETEELETLLALVWVHLVAN